ncbi:6-phosphogluconolactonase [Candidatus Similichlamydia epinepheli]|uniref:6-phosphogluconolactonase n=1 Tax=Candidatus Similichlamydia epinepheli TaxID=1903953 RepID=UPI0013006823|nr:6-phosphogluconolactonase [Candidatus Similichlamydia epinepheli]
MRQNNSQDASFYIPGSFEETISSTVKIFYDYIRDSVREKGICRIALSGGNTPLPIFREFAKSPELEFWKSVEWFWVDERYVPIEDKESNFGNAFSIMKVLKGCQFFPIVTNASLPPEELADMYSDTIREALPFDIALLGIGDDGHFASFFPDHSVFLEEKKLLEEAYEMPLVESLKVDEKGWRISLSLQSIFTSSNVWVLVTGSSKRLILDKVINRKDPSLPANLLLGRKNVLFIFDKDSSSQLELKNDNRD